MLDLLPSLNLRKYMMTESLVHNFYSKFHLPVTSENCEIPRNASAQANRTVA